jgi:hypothetical protein
MMLPAAGRAWTLTTGLAGPRGPRSPVIESPVAIVATGAVVTVVTMMEAFRGMALAPCWLAWP